MLADEVIRAHPHAVHDKRRAFPGDLFSVKGGANRAVQDMVSIMAASGRKAGMKFIGNVFCPKYTDLPRQIGVGSVYPGAFLANGARFEMYDLTAGVYARIRAAGANGMNGGIGDSE